MQNLSTTTLSHILKAIFLPKVVKKVDNIPLLNDLQVAGETKARKLEAPTMALLQPNRLKTMKKNPQSRIIHAREKEPHLQWKTINNLRKLPPAAVPVLQKNVDGIKSFNKNCSFIFFVNN